MSQTTYHDVVAASTTADPAPETGEVRFTRWQSGLIAICTLVVIYGICLGVMLAGGAVAHALDPTKQVDIFAALHNQWVVGVLLGASVLWLLPPHPWAKRVVASGPREQPVQTAGRTEDGGDSVATAQLEGPEAVHRPDEERWAGASLTVARSSTTPTENHKENT